MKKNNYGTKKEFEYFRVTIYAVKFHIIKSKSNNLCINLEL